jgi:hypothetical protein
MGYDAAERWLKVRDGYKAERNALEVGRGHQNRRVSIDYVLEVSCVEKVSDRRAVDQVPYQFPYPCQHADSCSSLNQCALLEPYSSVKDSCVADVLLSQDPNHVS